MACYRPPGPAPGPALVADLTRQQHALRERLRHGPLPHEPRLIGDCNASFPTPDTIFSVFGVLEFPSLALVEKAYRHGPVAMPCVPGFLSFREAPNALACLRGYKLPEPTRLADFWAEEFKKEVR